MLSFNFSLNGKNFQSVKVDFRMKHPEKVNPEFLIPAKGNLLSFHPKDDDLKNSYFVVDLAEQVKHNLAFILRDNSYEMITDNNGNGVSQEGIRQLMETGKLVRGGNLELSIFDINTPLYNKYGELMKDTMVKHLYTTTIDINNYINVNLAFKNYAKRITNICKNVDFNYDLIEKNRFTSVEFI